MLAKQRALGVIMTLEFHTSAGTVRLTKVGHAWGVKYTGKQRKHWHSGNAESAITHQLTGLSQRDDRPEPDPQDIIDWRPLEVPV